MVFDLNSYLKLIKQLDLLKEKGKSLYEYDPAKYHQLMNYRILLTDHFAWKNKEKYLELIILFITKQIEIEEFIQQFHKLRNLIEKNLNQFEKKLKNETLDTLSDNSNKKFKLNLKSEKFTDLLMEISNYIELYDSDISFEDNLKNPDLLGYGLSEEYLKILLENEILPRLAKYYI